MKYTDLIYDFDGTLADSYPIFAESFLELLKERGITPPYEEALSYLKISVQTAIDAYIKDEDPKAFRRVFRDRRNRMMIEKGLPMPGGEDLLRFVKENGGRNYIYTHSPSYIWDLLEKWGLRSYFEGGVTADDDFPVKPAPDALLFLAEHCNLNVKECLMIGDRPIDALAGMNAGMLGFLWDEDDLYKVIEVDYHTKDISDVAKIVGI